MREREYHLHPINMSDEMKYDYHKAIMARPGRGQEQDQARWIRGLQEAMYDGRGRRERWSGGRWSQGTPSVGQKCDA